MTGIRTFMAAIITAFALFLFTPAASASDPQIETARAEGVIGERIDGYLGIVSSADAEIVRKVQDINNRRRALYEQTSRETGATVQQVARIAGEKQLADRVRPGEFYMDESGVWQRR
jgi:uncharacterized protein YdbL (DUF1318 family)